MELAEVYVLDTKNVDDITVQQIWEKVSEQRREKVRKYRFRKDAVLSICATRSIGL